MIPPGPRHCSVEGCVFLRVPPEEWCAAHLARWAVSRDRDSALAAEIGARDRFRKRMGEIQKHQEDE